MARICYCGSIPFALNVLPDIGNEKELFDFDAFAQDTQETQTDPSQVTVESDDVTGRAEWLFNEDTDEKAETQLQNSDTIDPRLLLGDYNTNDTDENTKADSHALADQHHLASSASPLSSSLSASRSRQTTASRQKYACPVEGCEKPFRYPKDLSRHVRTHLSDDARDLKCPKGGCKYAQKGFQRQDALARHVKAKHPDLM